MAELKEKFTQEYIGIKDILEDGTIITENNKYVVIMEISPQNFANNDESDQEQILETYNTFIQLFTQMSFRIKSVTYRMQTDSYAHRFREAAKSETKDKVINMINDHIEFSRTESRRSSVDRRFYFIFFYDPEIRRTTMTREDDILDELEKAKRLVKNYFAQMGNPIIEFENPMYDVTSILYNHFNRDAMFSQPLDSRFKRTIRDYELVYNVTSDDDLPPIDLRDLLAPRSIKSDNEDYLLVNGKYYSYLCMQANDYPSYISPVSWLYELMNLGDGFEVDVFFEKQNRKVTLKDLKWKRKRTRPRAEDAKYDDDNFEIVKKVDEDITVIEDRLRTQRENLYQMYVLVTVYADTKQELYDKIEILDRVETSYSCTLKPLKYEQELGFASAIPFNDMAQKVKNESHHNVTTQNVTYAYPFISPSLSDKDGVILGVSNDSLIIFDPFNTAKLSNANEVIVGKSGSGKTYSMLSFTTRERLLGVSVYIFAPDKASEFIPICKALDGTFIDMSASSQNRINPFDIWPVESEADSQLYGKSENEKSWLIEKIESLKIYYKFFLPSMDPDQEAIMGEVTERIYKKYGLTRNNRSLYKKTKSGARVLKKVFPTYSDLVAELKIEVEEGNLPKSFYTVFNQFVEGPLKSMNGQTNVDLKNKYVVFDFESFKNNKKFMAPMMFIVLEYVMGKIRSDKTERKIVALDEGWLLLDDRSPQVNDFVVNIFRTIRAANGSVVFSTQSLTDFYAAGERTANAILDNSAIHLLLGMEETGVEKIREKLKLSEEECTMLKKIKRGQALLCAGRNHIPLSIIASAKEHELYTTDPEALKKKLQRQQKESLE